MEQPSTGRAIINDAAGQFEIVVPATRNWFVIISGVWGVLSSCSIVTVFGFLLRSGEKLPAALWFIFVPGLALMSFAGLSAFRILIWQAIGKEVIIFSHGEVTLIKKGALFSKPKTYDLGQAKSFRLFEDPTNDNNRRWSANSPYTIKNTGTLRFDNGMETLKFGAGLDEAEARFILKKLKEKAILSDKNF